MNLPPKDYTSQEYTIAKVLDDFWLRYDTQHFFLSYTVDFWIPEIKMVIEADGIYGHYKKRDVKRDMELMNLSMVDSVLHVKDSDYKKIKETIWQALNKLTNESPKSLQNESLNNE